jgi:hypothetical protein
VTTDLNTNIKTFISSSAGVNPLSLLQVTIKSTDWTVELHWVDENGVLVFRKSLDRCTLLYLSQHGHTSYLSSNFYILSLLRAEQHDELTSKRHLWVLIAIPTSSTTCSTARSPNSNFLSSPGDVCLLRICEYSLWKDRCTVLLWTPLCSITVFQRNRHMLKKLLRMKDSLKASVATEPVMHIQIC